MRAFVRENTNYLSPRKMVPVFIGSYAEPIQVGHLMTTGQNDQFIPMYGGMQIDRNGCTQSSDTIFNIVGFNEALRRIERLALMQGLI